MIDHIPAHEFVQYQDLNTATLSIAEGSQKGDYGCKEVHY